MKLVANVIGATGLVGKQLVSQLLENPNFEKVKIFVRRKSGVEHEKLEEHIVDFNNKKCWEDLLTGNVLFSTLGTTLKQAGGKEKQFAVDYTLNYKFAETAKKNGIATYVLVSSMSANSNAKLFYPRMKGQLDDDVTALQFEQISILRPGPLAGDRQEKRLGEIIGFPVIEFLTKFMLKKYRPIPDKIVARAMINSVLTSDNNKYIWEGEEVFDLANEK